MRKSISHTSAFPLYGGIENQKSIIMADDIDIYRLQVSVDQVIGESGSLIERLISLVSLKNIIVSSATISSNEDGYKIPHDNIFLIDPSGPVLFPYKNYKPLVFDRRGTESYMTDHIYFAAIMPPELYVNINLLFEGYAK